MTWRVEIKKSAAKAISALPGSTQKRVIAAIERLEDDPRPRGCRKLTGAESTYRIRVGNYRIIYDIIDERVVVLVLRVRHRRDVYR